MDHHYKESLAIKYLSGEASITELEELKALLKSDAAFKKQFVELRDIWNVAHPNEYNSHKAFLRFKDRIKQSEIREKKSTSFQWLKYAAVAALIAISLLVGKMFLPSPQEELKYYTFQTIAGERQKVQLPDGTIVWLSGQTELTYTSAFNDMNRIVNLNGEAFFDVKHNAHKPFEVYSGNHVVKVLGTRFKLEARADASIVTTVLEEGKVQITIPERQLRCVLLPGQKSVYDKRLKELRKRIEPDMEKYTAITRGQLVFKDEPLHVLSERLEDWFGVTITVDSAIQDLRFTGTFENESIEDVLNILSMSNGIKFTRTNEAINITLN
ncbi:FecR domain-containing protein [Carboxylicivirga sediminis]|uniref:FecR domain-containing protein n=1 Tax=Carboxylicivirga sediminis TaxID=2006564 RepID=A0A941F4M7_9BACT|nr:FecR domain-containing protein [Carboxylicivirga sediminis]MBR8536349.1 FecR domain-containing protein [Carboxylicivirga sediminis]